MKTKHVGNWSCNLCECRFLDSKLLNGHYDEDHSDWEKENTRSRLSRCEPTIEEESTVQDQTSNNTLDVTLHKNLESGDP